ANFLMKRLKDLHLVLDRIVPLGLDLRRIEKKHEAVHEQGALAEHVGIDVLSHYLAGKIEEVEHRFIAAQAIVVRRMENQRIRKCSVWGAVRLYVILENQLGLDAKPLVG